MVEFTVQDDHGLWLVGSVQATDPMAVPSVRVGPGFGDFLGWGAEKFLLS